MTAKLIYLARRAATVVRDDWPPTWRSHAVFASQFPALEANISWLRYCNRVDQPVIVKTTEPPATTSCIVPGVANTLL